MTTSKYAKKYQRTRALPRFYTKYTDDIFDTPTKFQEFLNAGHTLRYDYVIVEGMLFTMHEYDLSGQTVTWANLKHKMMMSVDTSNRYGETGYRDAQVYMYPADYTRNDINYAE